jgi:hypothetical protein
VPAYAVVPFPRELYDRHRPTLANDFGEQLRFAAFAPDGSVHAIGHAFYNAYRYAEPESKEFSADYVTELGPDLTVRSQRLLEVESGTVTGIAIAPSGAQMITCDDNTTLVDGRSKQLAKLVSFAGDDMFAVVRTSSGGALCGARGCYAVEGGFVLARGSERTDKLQPVAMIRSDDESKLGTPWLKGKLPAPSLFGSGALKALGAREPFWFWMRGLAAFDGGALLTCLSARGDKAADYCYLLVDRDGAPIAKLKLPESPYPKLDLDAFVDHAHRRIVWKSGLALCAFGFDGRSLGKLALTAAAVKPLAALKLVAISGCGELLLWHDKQRWLLRTDPIDDWKHASDVIAAAARGAKPWLAATKKQHEPVNWRWVM